MTMQHVTDWISSYIDGELTPERKAQVESHAAACSACREALAELRQVSSVVSGLADKPLPPGFLTRLRARQAREAPSRLLPLRGVAFGLASLAALFVVYEGKKERPQDLVSQAASSLPEPRPAAGFGALSGNGARELASTAGALKADRAVKSGDSLRAPGRALGEAAAPEPPRYSNELLHQAVEEEKRRMGVVGYVPQNPRVKAMKAFIHEQQMEGNEIVRLAAAPPPPALRGASPELLARQAAQAPLPQGGLSGGAAGFGAGAAGSAVAYDSKAQFSADKAGAAVKSQGDMADLWARYAISGPPPSVDFSKDMLVVLLQGQGRWSIVDAQQSEGRLLVRYRQDPSGSPFPSRVVPLSDLPVEFQKLP